MREVCPICEGTGWETAEEPKTGYPIPVLCQECGGSGFIGEDSGENR